MSCCTESTDCRNGMHIVGRKTEVSLECTALVFRRIALALTLEKTIYHSLQALVGCKIYGLSCNLNDSVHLLAFGC